MASVRFTNYEGQKYEIPPSVILALAISNSDFGRHQLARDGHNHFQIACSHNPLTEGIIGQIKIAENCFSHYQSAWTSFRANSLLLTSPLYRELHLIAKDSPQIWASGLEKMQYPNADKILGIIQTYNLTRYDSKVDV